MARSIWKLQFLSKALIRKLFLIKISKIKARKIILFRSSTITINLLGKTWFVHTGLKFNKIKITKLMVGYKFGEFAFSRKPFFYPRKDLRKTKLLRR